YGQQTGNYVPLRLQEARAALFDPMPSLRNLTHASLRTTTAVFNGAQLTCVLLSAREAPANSAPGRHWGETEECIDPATGLLQVHSQLPGRYYAYDYTNAPTLGGHPFPRKVTVTEGGKTITEISVDGLMVIPAPDPSLFAPTVDMKAAGRAIALTGAQKVSRVVSGGSGAAAIICVFGVLTPSGQLLEAHSLQPSDPNSEAAV